MSANRIVEIPMTEEGEGWRWLQVQVPSLLRDRVRHIYLLASGVGPDSGGAVRILPDGHTNLVCRIHGPDSGSPVQLQGIQRVAWELPVIGNSAFLIVQVGPGVLFHWTGAESGKLVDNLVDAAPILGLHHVSEFMDTARYLARGLGPRPLYEWLNQVACRPSRLIRDSTRRLLDGREHLPITRLADLVGASRRTVSRRLRLETGVSGKTFARIGRFQHTWELLRSGQIALADVSVDAGFADQAHMTREFRALTGQSPVELLRGAYSVNW